MDKFGSQKGFTLVEVMASIVIITIILIGVSQLILFTNKTATSNNSKLVTTHLAKATIERIKLEAFDAYFPLENIGTIGKTYTKNDCLPDQCTDQYEFFVNDQTYDVTVKVSQSEDEKELNLINVYVEVKQANKNIQSSVEGYVVNSDP